MSNPSAMNSMTLHDFVSRHSLPAKVIVTSGYSSLDDEDTLSTGELITLEALNVGQAVVAVDSAGKEHLLPANTKHLFEVMPENPLHDNIKYESIAKLMQAKPAPRKVRLVDSFDTGDEKTTLYAGDIITILTSSKKSGICRVLNQLGERMSLSADMKCVTTPQLDDATHTIADLVEYTCPFRVRAVRITGDNTGTDLQLNRIYTFRDITEEMAVVARLGEEKLIVPLRIELHVCLIDGVPLPIPRSMKRRTSTTSILTIRSQSIAVMDSGRCIGRFNKGSLHNVDTHLPSSASIDGSESIDMGDDKVSTPIEEQQVDDIWSVMDSPRSTSAHANRLAAECKQQQRQIEHLKEQLLLASRERDFWREKYALVGFVSEDMLADLRAYCAEGLSQYKFGSTSPIGSVSNI